MSFDALQPAEILSKDEGQPRRLLAVCPRSFGSPQGCGLAKVANGQHT
jgi:hypothetical protein